MPAMFVNTPSSLQGKTQDMVMTTVPLMYHWNGEADVGAGKLNKAKNADCFLAYLASVEAQNIYASYGFLKAAAEELKRKKR